MKKNKIVNAKREMPSEVKRGIIIVVVAVLVVLFMYFLTTRILASSDDGSSEDKVRENAIQYDEILAGESFDKSGEYYVIYYDSTDQYSSIGSLISSYQLNNTDTKLYSVDLSNGMNSKYVTDGNVVTKDASSLRVKNNTLIKFNNGKVEDVITDIDEITSILNS